LNPKIAIVIVVVIVLLFVGGVSTGALHKDNSTKGDWATWLNQTFVHPDLVQLENAKVLPKSCLQSKQLVMSFGLTCTLNVDGGVNVRRLILKLQAGTAKVLATAKPESNGKKGIVLFDDTISGAGATARIDVYQKGADVNVTCLVAQCRVQTPPPS
jgi:hypothetical protein